MSQSTTAAVRQYEIKVNITLLTMITWAARANGVPLREAGCSEELMIHLGKERALRRRPRETGVPFLIRPARLADGLELKVLWSGGLDLRPGAETAHWFPRSHAVRRGIWLHTGGYDRPPRAFRQERQSRLNR